MGQKASDAGISIQFVKQDGLPDGVPVYGRYAQVFGRPRTEIQEIGPGNDDEKAHPGSDDWLTMVAVADSKEKLADLINESGIAQLPANTSGSSRRVQLEMHLGGVRQSLKDRITIASGPVVSLDPKRLIIHTNHVKVLPAGIQIGDLAGDNPLLIEFSGSAQTFVVE